MIELLPDYYKSELYHYGVIGMKWGVRRAAAKARANIKLGQKALMYDAKSEQHANRAAEEHAKIGAEQSSKKAIKIAKHTTKADALRQKAQLATKDRKRRNLEQKAATNEYKADKTNLSVSRVTNYSSHVTKAMRYSIKSYNVAKKAAVAREKIASNEAYISMMNKKMSALSQDDLNGRYSFVKKYVGA